MHQFSIKQKIFLLPHIIGFLTLFLFTVPASISYAQNADKSFTIEINQIKTLIPKQPDSAQQIILQILSHKEDNYYADSTKGNLYYMLSECSQYKNELDEALIQLDSARFYFTKSDYNNGLGEVWHATGNNWLMRGHIDQAIDCYKKAVLYRHKAGDISEMAKTLSNLGIAYFKITQLDSSMLYHEQTLKIRLQINDSAGIAKTLSNIGNIYLFRANDSNALVYYKKAIEYLDTTIHTRPYASIINNIGNILNRQGENNEALLYFLNALQIFEEFGDTKSIAKIFNNIALIHFDEGNIEEAMRYHSKALEYFYLIQDEIGIADTYFYLGRIYHLKNDYNKAKTYFNQSLNLEIKNGDLGGIADCYHNLGVIYLDTKQDDSAAYYLNRAANKFQKSGNNYGLATAQCNLSRLYYLKRDYKSAYSYGQKALKTAQKYDGLLEIYNAYGVISQSLEGMGLYQKSLEYLKKAIVINDTLFTRQKAEAILEIESKYQLEKKQQAIDMQNMQLAKRDLEFKSKEKEVRFQKKIRNIILGTMVLMSVLIFILIRNLLYRKMLNTKLAKQREDILDKNEELAQLNEELRVQQQQIIEQNKVLIQQNLNIEESNKSWQEGIKYAEYIQHAVLPPIHKLIAIFKSHFVMYLPKEIVGGDFYWVHQNGSKVLIALGDCTGHGVPGGFLSMLSIAFIKEIVAIKNNFSTNEVLDDMRQQMIEALQQSGDMLEYTDGIDLSLLVIDTNQKTIEYAGAKGKVIIINQNKAIVLKGNRMPVGFSPKMKPFTCEKHDLSGNETIYMFTDGMVDQYNPEDEKFGIQRLINFCESNAEKPLTSQKEILFQEFKKWKNDFEQIDDVTVLAFKI